MTSLYPGYKQFMKIQKGEWKPRPQDIDAKSVGSDSETSVSETSVSETSVSESFYCMYETDQSESTDDEKSTDVCNIMKKVTSNPY
jgi:hypothetical protein